MSQIFKLSDYNVIAFDFDFTLVQYNISSFLELQYKCLASFLNNKGYTRLPTSLDPNDVDFIRKGLFVDIIRGNILNLTGNGRIIQACHGSNKLSLNEIVKIYGAEMKWTLPFKFIKNQLIQDEGYSEDETYSFMEFTNSPAILVYSKLIDIVDEDGLKVSYKNVWNDLMAAIKYIYSSEGDFLPTMGRNVFEYVYKCDEIKDWLLQLKQRCKLILISSAESITVHFLAKHIIGPDWKQLFDTVIVAACKPKFFTLQNPFTDIGNSEAITLTTSVGYYKNGNWKDLHKMLIHEMGPTVKPVYIGDSVVQDVYAPATVSLDTVSIMEESLAEGIFPGVHPHAKYMRSNFWGSNFIENGVPTLMGDLIMNHAKLCVPSLKYLAGFPLDYEHVPFWLDNKSDGTVFIV